MKENTRHRVIMELWFTAGFQGGPMVVWPDGHKITLCDWLTEQMHPANRPAFLRPTGPSSTGKETTDV